MKKQKKTMLTAIFTAAIALTLGWHSAAPAAALSHFSRLPDTLVPVGHTVGLKLFSEGILVVGLSELETANGETVIPAKTAGLKVGDLILQCNGVEVESTEHFQDLVREDENSLVDLQVRRGNDALQLTAEAVTGSDGVRRLGAWVRDSLAGIGTMTFYDPASGVFGALGHGVNDTDTNLLLSLDEGAIMPSSVKAVKPGLVGSPGELRGDFDLTRDLGALYANTEQGVFGKMGPCDLVACHEALPVATAEEVRPGDATILCNVAGGAVEEYTVRLSHLSAAGSTRNMVVEVTDPRLLEITGGIVQGMSGSPILQNGKIIGAVTHVLVDDPTRGYGIFIENMLKAAE